MPAPVRNRAHRLRSRLRLHHAMNWLAKNDPVLLERIAQRNIPEIVKIFKSLRKKRLVLFDDSATKRIKGWELTEEGHQLVEDGL